MGEAELRRVLVARPRPVGKLGDEGEGADRLGPHPRDGEEFFEPGGLGGVGLELDAGETPRVEVLGAEGVAFWQCEAGVLLDNLFGFQAAELGDEEAARSALPGNEVEH